MSAPTIFYNENDPYAAAWLRNLIEAGAIAPGIVDERSIVDIEPSELAGYVQCHFFAGIGVWSYALRRAGWPDARPVWTGSCPCQPFSAAGKGEGDKDERHLWPVWQRLIRECRPECVFGEQVASDDGLAWLDVVSTDMEAQGDAIGAVDTCAAGFGAPHIRQRLYFVAHANRSGRAQRRGAWGHDARLASAAHGGALADPAGAGQRELGWRGSAGSRNARAHADQHHDGHGQLVDAADPGPQERGDTEVARGTVGQEGHTARAAGEARGVGDAGVNGSAQHEQEPRQRGDARALDAAESDRAGATNGFWRAADWLPCRDGKARPVEPGTFPLVTGLAADMGCVRPGEVSPRGGKAPWRVGMLRGYGNAINAEQAQAFIEAYMSVAP